MRPSRPSRAIVTGLVESHEMRGAPNPRVEIVAWTSHPLGMPRSVNEPSSAVVVASGLASAGVRRT